VQLFDLLVTCDNVVTASLSIQLVMQLYHHHHGGMSVEEFHVELGFMYHAAMTPALGI
jgi:hypothetical protein